MARPRLSPGRFIFPGLDHDLAFPHPPFTPITMLSCSLKGPPGLIWSPLKSGARLFSKCPNDSLIALVSAWCCFNPLREGNSFPKKGSIWKSMWSLSLTPESKCLAGWRVLVSCHPGPSARQAYRMQRTCLPLGQPSRQTASQPAWCLPLPVCGCLCAPLPTCRIKLYLLVAVWLSSHLNVKKCVHLSGMGRGGPVCLRSSIQRASTLRPSWCPSFLLHLSSDAIPDPQKGSHNLITGLATNLLETLHFPVSLLMSKPFQ